MKSGIRLVVVGATLLLSIGLSVVASVSDAQAVAFNVGANHFATRQLLYAAVGVFLGFVVLPRLDPHLFQRRGWALVLAAAVVFGLVSVWIPGLADAAQKGSHRWLRLPGFKLQPSELVRVFVCVLAARWCGAVRCRNEEFWQGTALPCLCLAPVLALLFKQPDYGSAILTVAVAGAILVVAGSRPRHLAIFGAVAVGALAALILSSPEHIRRVLGALASDQVSTDETRQVMASLQAFRNGGLLGAGYGRGIMKEGYLPEAHTDFILAMAGEELGLVATLAVVAGYLLILAGGWRIARSTPEKYSKLLAVGLTLHFCLAAGANIAVVTKWAPTKGLALPLLSYGGSNMVASMLVLGLLVATARHAPADFPDTRAPSAW